LTQSIPNGFSTEQLQEMLADCRSVPFQEQDNKIDPQSDDYAERISDCADKHIQAATEEIADPMVHKAMLVFIANNFIRFHNRVAEELFERGDHDAAMAWSRDAGKFQACMNILATVNCGENDFTCMEE